VPTSTSDLSCRATCTSPGFKVEAKRKKSGYKFLYDALEQDDCDMLVVRQDKARRLYVLEEETLLALMRQAGIVKP
jgi:hypothetical protein